MAKRFSLLLMMLQVVPASALADWPSQRGNPQRTGSTTGTSNIITPVPYWRVYLGGSLGGLSVIVDNLDDDADNEVVYVTGGRLISRDHTGAELWASPGLGLSYIVGVDDLDGDGKVEIVASSSNHIYILDGDTGALLWAEPDGEMGSIGGTRMADVDGDNLPEILIQECGCCGVNSGNPGFVYSFASGFASPALLWTLPYARCGGGRALTVADLDGTGPPEVLVTNSRTLAVLDGATGVILDETPDLWNWVAVSNCTPVEADGTAGDELACVGTSNQANSDNLRRLFLVDYDATGTPTATVPWNIVLAPNDGGEVRWSELVGDLDGDGQAELMVSTRNPTDGWATLVIDAATGAELGRLPGEQVSGYFPSETGTGQIFLTADANNTTLMKAYTFDRTATPSLTEVWTLADRLPIRFADRVKSRISNISQRIMHTDLDKDGIDELIVRQANSTDAVMAYSLVSGTPVEIARFDFPARFTPQAYWLFPLLAAGRLQVGVARNDGYLTVFDDSLNPINLGQDGGVPGIRIGGYFAPGSWRDLVRTPLAAPMDSSDASPIIVRDSRSYLLRLDASESSWVSPPVKVWERPGIAGATLLPNATPPSIACMSGSRALLIDADNNDLWASEVVPGPFLNDLVPAQLNADGVTDLAFQWGDSTNTLLQTRGISGADGTTLWDAQAFEPSAGRQPAGISIDDHNGDGTDDVYTAGAGMRVLSGSDGQVIATSASGHAYGLITHYNVDGDAANERLVHGGFTPVRAYDNDLTTLLWASPHDDRPYPYGAVADCGGGRSLLTTASWGVPAGLRIFELTAGTPGDSTEIILAGGQLFATQVDAMNAGAFMGQLSSVTVHSNLTGDGSPTAMVGSADGHLYAINPCDATLRFAYDFGATVGEAIYADTNGDGLDEILISVSDGHLYNLRNDGLPQPDYVYETDPPNGITTEDVDRIDTIDTLHATWAAVPGATSYEVSVLHNDGTIITTPAWLGTPNTEITLTALPLQDRNIYRFAVRALDSQGTSVDLLSDGVYVTIVAPPVDEVEDTGSDTSLADTGGADTAGADTGGADTGTTSDTGAPDTGGGADTADAGGPGSGGSPDDCGCSSVRSPSPRETWPLFVTFAPAAFLFLRRRRRE